MEEKYIKEGIIEEKDGKRRLIAGRCKCCGRVAYPIKPVCISCGKDEDAIEKIYLSDEGTIYSYTTTMRPVSQLETPCSFAYIDMPEGPRLFAPVDTKENEEIKIGAKAVLNICELWKEEDTSVIGYRFIQKDQ